MEIRKLNTLRGLAALIVVMSHFSNATDWLGGALGHGAGHYGVMLFFILSGFLMSYLYLAKRTDAANIQAYGVARVARVLPLFLVVVSLSFFVSGAGYKNVLFEISNLNYFLAHLLMLNGEEVLWTIAPEVQFYALFVLIWWAFHSRFTLLVATMLAVSALMYWLQTPVPIGSVKGIPYQLHIVRSLPYFLVGVVVGQIYLRYKVEPRFQSHFFVPVLLLIPALYPQVTELLFGFQLRSWYDPVLFLAITTVFASVLFLVPDENPVLVNSVGDYLGKISYSIYLWHLPILWQTQRLPIENASLLLPIYLACMVATCHLSFKFIELPASRFIRRRAA